MPSVKLIRALTANDPDLNPPDDLEEQVQAMYPPVEAEPEPEEEDE